MHCRAIHDTPLSFSRSVLREIAGVLCVLPFIILCLLFWGIEPAESSSEQEIKKEIALGAKVIREVEAKWPRVLDAVKVTRVETILARQRPFLDRSLDYRVFIVDAKKMINAFSLPGGATYVTTGMLDFVRTDHELAGVIAHELVHADKKHVMRQVARNQRLTLLALAIVIASRGEGAAILMSNIAQVAVMNAYSIEYEKEADAVGMKIMLEAGYNPVGMLTLQERLLEESMRRPHVEMGVAQSHPEARERIAAAKDFMEKNNIPIHRKVSLGLLRTEVRADSGDVYLNMDGKPIWSFKNNNNALIFLEKTQKKLDESLQLETLPYDIRLFSRGKDRALWIGSKRVVSQSEMPEGTEPLDLLKERLHQCLEKTRSKYPFVDYY